MIDDKSEPGSWQKALKDRAMNFAVTQSEGDDTVCPHGTHETMLKFCGVCALAEKSAYFTVTDHAEAAALALEKVTAGLRAGRSPEDLGADVVLIGRMMARRT